MHPCEVGWLSRRAISGKDLAKLEFHFGSDMPVSAGFMYTEKTREKIVTKGANNERALRNKIGFEELNHDGQDASLRYWSAGARAEQHFHNHTCLALMSVYFGFPPLLLQTILRGSSHEGWFGEGVKNQNKPSWGQQDWLL